MASILYDLIIYPLFLFFEFVFVKAFALTGNYGITIIILSLTINFLVLPLYRSADSMQNEEREKEAMLSHWVDHIKKTFKGDERYMMLQTYYRQNNYKPTDSLKGTVSLLLQIPFFIAAYRFLSGLQQLNGVSFGVLRDLGRPDALLSVAGVTVNIMPIIMTVINLVSGAIYTKGMPHKTKIQLYAMALVFLVILYSSPSGLVFYWTLNNLFSLCKNVFYKLPHPHTILKALAASGSVVLLVYMVVRGDALSSRKQLYILIMCTVMILPLVLSLLRHVFSFSPIRLPEDEDLGNSQWPLYLLGVVYLTVLLGVLAPSSVIVSSPADFININDYRNPLLYITGSLNVMAGFFLVWFSVFYMLTARLKKPLFSCVLWIAAVVSTINYMFFAKNMGNMSPKLIYDNPPAFFPFQEGINILIIIAVAIVAGFVFYKFGKVVPILYVSLIIGSIVLVLQNINGTLRQVQEIEKSIPEDEPMAEIPLSKEGKNVIVFMLDRSIGPYVPYLMNEKPELKEKFSGFTYYKNTVSMGTSTNAGTGALFGGYEYSPYEMNKRSNEMLADKQNEALRVMPVVFADQGYRVTVCDPPYAGYTWIGDLSIYSEYPSIHAYHTRGRFNTVSKEASVSEIRRRFVGYSFMKVMPLYLQPSFYADGTYNDTADAHDYTDEFMDSYTVLENLPSITTIVDDDINTFLMIDNETSHEACKLQVPGYVPENNCNNSEYEERNKDRFVIDGHALKMDTDWQLNHYYVDMAAFLKLGEWFDYLRDNDVYDNTRIILVSDHGFGLKQIDGLQTEEGFDLQWFLPVFMMKDFDAKEYSVSEEFMTNADTPSLAMKDVIVNPVNPFTGNAINMSVKENNEVIVFHTSHWGINENNGTTFMEAPDNRWFHVQNDVYDMKNWTQITVPNNK